MKIQLSTFRPDIKKHCRNVKECHSSHNFFSFVLENIFFIMLFILICSELLLVNELINISKISVLTSHMVIIYRDNPHQSSFGSSIIFKNVKEF